MRVEKNKTKENLSICITIVCIVMVAIIITNLKIILYDKNVYPSVFYSQEEMAAMKNVSKFGQPCLNCRKSQRGESEELLTET